MADRTTLEMARTPKPDVAFGLIVLRQAQGLTQKQVGQASGMPRSWVHKIERGKSDPKIKTVHMLAKGLKVPTRVLIAFSEARRAA